MEISINISRLLSLFLSLLIGNADISLPVCLEKGMDGVCNFIMQKQAFQDVCIAHFFKVAPPAMRSFSEISRGAKKRPNLTVKVEVDRRNFFVF